MPKFILASASPRRRQLLTEAGYDFDVIISDVDESTFDFSGTSVAEHACILALAKAKDVAKKSPQTLVVGADTVADFDGEIIGKAETAAHAEEIMRKLFSKPHEIITAIAMVKLADGIEKVEYDKTTVFPRKLSNEQIASHIASGKWKNRAGAYGIKAGGDEFIERIQGSETNVSGLSMELFGKMIKDLAGP